MDLPEAFYLTDGPDRFAPTVATQSPWDDAAQHGGPPLALAAHCIERVSGGPGRRLARITADFLGAIPRAPMDVTVLVVRLGRRVTLTEATLSVDGRAVVVARGWHVVLSSGVPPSDPGEPQVVPGEQPQLYFEGMTDWGYGEAIEWRFAEGSFLGRGTAKVWTRLRVPLIAGVPLAPLSRALVVADAANGVSGGLPLSDFWFIPPGVSVAMAREPDEEWVRLTAVTRRSDDGLGVTSGQLSDRAGYCGEVVQPLMIAPR